jgi:hypothetical protein
MQFEFEGELYRIAFHHPVPTDLYYHAGHEAQLVRDSTNQKPGHGPMRIFCAECEARTHHEVQLFPAPKNRGVECGIYMAHFGENSKPEWKLITRGVARLNRKAKDQYTREGGRVASLNDALSHGHWEAAGFCVAALAAYNNRKNYRAQAGVTL